MRRPGLVLLKATSCTSRSYHSSSRRQVQRLLWAGKVLDRTTASFQEVPKDWLLSLGVQQDVEQGISFTKLSSSPSHSLISYTTLPPSLPISSGDNAERDDFGRVRVHPAGLQKVISIGRNTFGELGLGFSSQEATWGMVTSGFEGRGGIEAVQCGLGSSWLVTSESRAEKAPSLLYSFGNHTAGQLGLGGIARPYALSEGGEPQLELYSFPRRVDEDKIRDGRLERVAVGLDHFVALLSKPDGSQETLTCGNNTDGQLGDLTVKICSPSLITLKSFDPPLPPSSEDPVVGVAAGGDSSILWTASGRVWAWGNSEYGQCMVGGKPIDRISISTEASHDIAQSIEAKVVDVRFGGSFVVVLDEAGNVYTAGFGALGQGKDNLESHTLKKILSGATSISTGLEQASAVIRDAKTGAENIMVWGLDTPAGRLAIGGRKPWPSYMVASRFTAEDSEHRIWQPCPVSHWNTEWTGKGQPEAGVKEVAHGRDVMWVLVEDGKDEVGRWAGR